MSTTFDREALRRKIVTLSALIVSAVGVTGQPSGTVYAVLANDCTFDLYQEVVGLLVVSDLLTDRGH